MSTFIIKEIIPIGGVLPPGGEPEQFTWTVENRNMPTSTWADGGQLRTNRTDYPGSNRVTEQVLGSHLNDMTFSGMWHNRFNRESDIDPESSTGDYAEGTKQRFIAMCRRGNTVEIQFQKQSVVGLIKSWNFSYKKRYKIAYEFTLSIHRDVSDSVNIFQTSQETLGATPEEIAGDMLSALFQHIDSNQNIGLPATQASSEETDISRDKVIRDTFNRTRRQGLLVGDEEVVGQAFGIQNNFSSTPLGIISDGAVAMDAFSKQVVQFAEVVDQRVLSLEANAELGLSASITRANLVIKKAYNLATISKSLKSSASLMYRNPIKDLNFDIWNKSRSSYGRRTASKTYKARQDLINQEKPEAIALYRPFAGESLYSISNRFYKNPNSWREIFRRNNLKTTTMTGTELLVIPSI